MEMKEYSSLGLKKNKTLDEKQIIELIGLEDQSQKRSESIIKVKDEDKEEVLDTERPLFQTIKGQTD